MGPRYYYQYPALTAKALKHKIFVPGLRYWYALSAFREFECEFSMKTAVGHLMLNFHISRSHAFRTLSRFNGLLWNYMPGNATDKKPGFVVIHSPKQVSCALGMLGPGKYERRELTEIVSQSCICLVFAQLLKAYQIGIPISRIALEAKFNISQRSQQLYIKRGGIKQAANYEVESVYTNIDNAIASYTQGLKSGRYLAGREICGKISIVTDHGVGSLIAIYKRIGNTIREHARVSETPYRRLLGVNNGVGFWVSLLDMETANVAQSIIERQLCKTESKDKLVRPAFSCDSTVSSIAACSAIDYYSEEVVPVTQAKNPNLVVANQCF